MFYYYDYAGISVLQVAFNLWPDYRIGNFIKRGQKFTILCPFVYCMCFIT